MIRRVKTPYGISRVYRRGAKGARESIMVIPGYSVSLSHNRELVDILASKGYDAFTFRPPRRKAVPTSAVLNRQRDIILSVLAATMPDGEKVYGVAHSLGSAALLKAAQAAPERFIELVLMQPPGLADGQQFSTLVRNVSRKTLRNNVSTLRDRHLHKLMKHYDAAKKPKSATTRKLIRSQLSSGYFIAKNPLLALREAQAAIAYDITDDAAVVKSSGVPVHIMRAHGDELFSTSKTDPRHERIMELEGVYSNIADENAPHDTFWLHPEQTAQLIDASIQHVTSGKHNR